jgi:hypothetical protein
MTLNKRQWLNTEDDGGTAFVRLQCDEVEHYTRSDGKKWATLNARMQISDCNRIIELDFSAESETPSTIENTRVKVRRLYRAVRQMRDAVLAACDELEGK